MYPCNYPGCEAKFTDHTGLMEHIFRVHGNRFVGWLRKRVSWRPGGA